jgi:hypothetical protein
MVFKFKYRRRFFWHTIVAEGVRYENELDRMVLVLPGKKTYEICHWKDCDCQLGPDWFLAQKEQMSKEAGTEIKTI